MTKGLTISTVAQMAGVSKTTVSRYLNGKYEFMSPQTRPENPGCILKTGYQPNHLAQSLKSRRSMLAGLVADIESPFSAAAVKAIGDVLGQAGYTLITVDTGGDPKRQQEALDSLVQRQVDGIIVNSAAEETQQLGRIQHSGIPVVLLDRFVGEGGFDIGYLENERPIQALLSHLREQEYGRIALFVQDYAAASPRYLRWKAFLDATARQDGGVGEPQVYVVDPQRQETLDSARAA
ncbi:MAG: LacI family DNA-binding transcriptional regulator [Oscillospiraceae bacterium]